MKVCKKEHIVEGFGLVPAGSLWDDDSPYLVKAGNFAKAKDQTEDGG